jgi:hypothetical protein
LRVARKLSPTIIKIANNPLFIINFSLQILFVVTACTSASPRQVYTSARAEVRTFFSLFLFKT